jgi:hypothetical protein
MAESGDAIKKIARDAEEWAARQKLLKLSEISIVLKEYDDIFSDFDPRMFDKRALSDDFLIQIKRASVEKKEGVIELSFLIPAEIQKSDVEAMIKKRLRDHFKKHYEQIRKDVSKIKKRGTIQIFLGVGIAVFGAMFLSPVSGVPENILELIQGVLFLLLEPAAWFTIWTGFDRIFDTWKELEPDLEFYRKMSKCEIAFTIY